MKNKTNAHQRGRNSRVFEEHSCGRGSASVRKRRAWQFYDPARSLEMLFESHFRATARAAALDAKHVRSVRHTAPERHVKDI